MKKGSIRFFQIIFIILILFLLFHLYFNEDIIDRTNKVYQLERDGVVIYKNVLTDPQIVEIREKCNQKDYQQVKEQLIHNETLKQIIQKETGDNNYLFQDYIWIIKKSSVHTCHRDNNGDFFNEGQKYKSYTMLVYLENMEKCLGVVPTSHKDVNSFNFNFTDPVVNLLCNKGDVILFDANLIHVGTMNQKENNLRIQLKVTHKEDLEAISYYQNYNKILDQENNMPLFVRKVQRKLSCLTPIISNYTQNENIRSATIEKEQTSITQKIFSYLFYGKSDFYNLPNAF